MYLPLDETAGRARGHGGMPWRGQGIAMAMLLQNCIAIAMPSQCHGNANVLAPEAGRHGKSEAHILSRRSAPPLGSLLNISQALETPSLAHRNLKTH